MTTTTDRSALARAIYATSHITGEFVLRSGVVSNEYFDKYRFEADPALLRDIASALVPLVPDGTEALAGLELGGVPIATVLSQLTGIPALFVRKEAKTYGTCQLAEGGVIDGTRLTVVEDVVTSGGQVITSCGDLRDRGAIVEHALCVIDRESGGPEGLAGIAVELHPLFTMTELKAAAGLTDRPTVSSSPRQGGVRGGSKSQGRTSPSMAANASSPQRSMPATGQGRLCRSKNPTARVSSGWPFSSPPIIRQWKSSEYSGSRAKPRRRPSSTAMSETRLDLDAGLLVDLLHRDLGRRVADVGPADRVEPHPGVGPLGEQDLAAVVADDRRHRDLRGDVALHALADAAQPLVEQRVGLGFLDRDGADVGRDLQHLLEPLLLVEALGEPEAGAGDGGQGLRPAQQVDGGGAERLGHGRETNRPVRGARRASRPR